MAFSKLSSFIKLLSILLLTGCTSDVELKNEAPPVDNETARKNNFGKLFGNDALKFGGRKKGGEEIGIGVNSFLWRSTLETLSFLPFSSVDPFGGVILTEWYVPENSPNERLKLNILILDRQLRADGIKITIFREIKESEKEQWKKAPVDTSLARRLEDAILMRARQMKVESLQ